MIGINGDRLLSDLRELATIGGFETGVHRIAFSDADLAARRWLVQKFQDAGLDAAMDRVGNVIGRAPDVATAILIGSHTDTVPHGGWLDGALGVIYGLEIARSAIASATAVGAVGVDVISFQDEEGTFLPFLGSRSFCGTLTETEIAGARAHDGRKLADALATVAQEAMPFRLDQTRTPCYLEAHIEQGPRLEAAKRRIGVVTGIVGIRRFHIRATGQADHAGTTPIAMRRDAGAALIALAAWVAQEFPRIAGPDVVWNIGSIAFRPGAANVVPGEADMQLEFRAPNTELLTLLKEHLLARIADTNGKLVNVEANETASIEPIAMAPALVGAIAAAATDDESMLLPSGAGHDAMVLARVVPAGMLFVPSIGGRSHNVSENTRDTDIVRGCEVMARAVANLRVTPA